MKPKRSLPVLLVSARDRTTAEEFISELIDNEVTETEGESEQSCEGQAGAGRVWRLVNKYYTADVEVRARGDDDPMPPRVEAHVAYFTPEECSASAETLVACAERRAGVAAAAGVRVLALAAARAGALAGWAARARADPVPLRDAAEGLPRVRDALHAHVWPGLRRLDRPNADFSYRDSDGSSSCGEEGEDEEQELDEDEDEELGEAQVERAEQFARALGGLAAWGAGARALPDAERRQRAELLLDAFCRALGEPLH